MGSREEIKQSADFKSSSGEITKLAYTHLHKGNTQRASECFESAVEKAKEEGDPMNIISCYLNAGACFVSRGQLTQGNNFLVSALKLAKVQKMDDSVSRTTDGKETHQVSVMEISADIYFNLGVAAQKVQKFRKAITYFKTSADYYLKTGCVLHAAESYANRASCHRRGKERTKEVACLVSAQQLYHEAGDGYNEAESCIQLARTYLRENLMDDCKEMLSTAKLLCLRITNRAQQGKLYTQFGLVYTSMGLYDLGIQNFERALPLVREKTETEQSLQAEAALLQNIGAAYNEKALFLEAMVYHKEAVVIHGKVHNHNSESKSLCNLAYAQTQLNQLQEAAKTFSNALTKAHQAKNSFLQFQTCEGLGSINHQMGRFDEAISCFRQALSILDQIREDTGIARERVMEKLSETTEAYQTPKEKDGTERDVESVQSVDEEEMEKREEMRNRLHSLASEEQPVAHHTRSKSLSSGEELSKVKKKARSLSVFVGEHDICSNLKQQSLPGLRQMDDTKLTISERRGAKLPPLKDTKASRKGKERMPPESGEATEASEYSADLQVYMNSYVDSSNTCTPSISSWSQDVQRQLAGLPALSLTPSAPGPRTVREGSLAIGENARDQYTVQEGSLAIGEKVRDQYTVQTIQEWSEGKGGKTCQTRSEIIQMGPPQNSSSNSDSNYKESQAKAKKQSKICTIL